MHIAGEVVAESICFGGGGGSEARCCAKTQRCNGQVALRQQKDLCPNEYQLTVVTQRSAKLHYVS